MANRPRGRPVKATPEVKQQIADIYVRFRKKGETPSVDDMWKEFGENFGTELAKSGKPLPIRKSTFGGIVRELKDEERRTQNEEGELDQPWSIGASLTQGIPPDITPTLLEIQRWCILAGQSFTVQEARWVAYLCRTAGTKPDIRNTEMITSLYFYAWRYALREKASKLLGKATVDTSDLDTEQMSWDPWVRATAERTRVIPPREATLGQRRKEQVQVRDCELQGRRPGQAPEAADYQKDNYFRPGFLLMPFFITSPELAIGLMLDIWPPAEAPNMKEPLDMQGQEVYALWILYLSKGPKWDHLTKEERNLLATRLKAEIRKNQQEVQIARGKLDGEDMAAFRAVAQKGAAWKIPAEFLIAVGYEAE